jgi:hypothetical protein
VNQHGQSILSRLYCVLFALAFLCGDALAINGPVTGFNTTTPYLIYYGGWNATQVDFARRNYRLVIVDAHNITAAQIATIQRGPDNISGTSDDVLVFSYISVGEDNRPGAPVGGDRMGPRIDPRASDTVPLSSITNALGLPSPGGTNYASYYLDTKSNPDGVPDKNSTFGGCFVNAGAPAWWTTLKNMTIATDGNAGLDELLTANVGKGCNCDGVFLDTIDTAAPNSFGGTSYEWTAPGMQTLIHRIATNYPTKLIMGNRGLFFYDPNYKHYAYTLRPYVNMVMFESYFTDSNNSDQTNQFFNDNKYDYAPKLNAEADRPDGFNIVALGYDHNPPQPQAVIDQDYSESMGIQGWPLYRTDPLLTSSFNTNASAWLATNADTQPPAWDSTAAQSATPPAARVGIQEAVSADQSVTVRWDVARDQTEPVRYNIYFTAQPTLNFATAIKLTHVSPAIPAKYLTGTGAGSYPFEYTITGLSNGVTYLFAVRAEDSAVPAHEDTNDVVIAATAGTNAIGSFRKITVDGNFSDWTGVTWAYLGAPDGNMVNFAGVQFANDTNYLYCHFKLFSAAAPFSDFNTHLFIDRDNNQTTGYQISGAALFGSEFMVESGVGYDQRNGGFNEGTVPGIGWSLAPGGSSTEFEFRISRTAAYSGGPLILGTNTFRLLLQDNRGSEVAVDTGIPYAFDDAPYDAWRAQYFTAAELTNAAVSGDAADPDGDGIPNLVEFAFNLNPRTVSQPAWPRAFVQNVSGQDFFFVQYIQRNAPAGIQYILQTSTDMRSWNSAEAAVDSATDNDDGTSLVTVHLLSSVGDTSRQFLRVTIQK